MAKNKNEITQIITLDLEYDDRYLVEDIKQGYFIVSIEDEEITSFKSEAQKDKQIPDEKIIETAPDEDKSFRAAGTGRASVIIAPEKMRESIRKKPQRCDRSEWIKVDVTVKPATLTLIFIAGQDNAEGLCPDGDGYDINGSVMCEAGCIYSTFLPYDENTASKVAGTGFGRMCTAQNAADFICSSLSSDISLSGAKLEYPLNALTPDGCGKSGMDSALAFEWRRLSSHKVWVVNTACASSSINSWLKSGTCYERAKAAAQHVLEIYKAELRSGHYKKGKSLLFWQQGESDAAMDAESYVKLFVSMCRKMKKDFCLDAIGIIISLANAGYAPSASQLYMTGPRTAQYLVGQNPGYPYIYVVCNAAQHWMSDADTAAYLKGKYTNGYMDLPFRSEKFLYSYCLPSGAAAMVKDGLFYQCGHNETGLSAADGMYRALHSKNKDIAVKWIGEDGKSMSSLILGIGEQAVLAPVADPVYFGKNVTCRFSSRNVSFDSGIYTATGVSKGNAQIKAYADGKELCAFKISVRESALNGLCRGDDGKWAYYRHSETDREYNGLAKCSEGWLYVSKGEADFSYTGLAKSEYGWWYVKEGKLDTSFTGTADNDAGTWYVENGHITGKYNGFALCKGGQYFIVKSRVSSYSGIVKYGAGCYYLKDGRFDESFTGFAENEYGRWFVRKGRVVFSYSGIRKENGKEYCVLKGRVAEDDGIIKCADEFYYIKDKAVASDYIGFVGNEFGTWLVVWGRIDTKANGTVTIDGVTRNVKNGKVISAGK